MSNYSSALKSHLFLLLEPNMNALVPTLAPTTESFRHVNMCGDRWGTYAFDTSTEWLAITCFVQSVSMLISNSASFFTPGNKSSLQVPRRFVGALFISGVFTSVACIFMTKKSLIDEDYKPDWDSGSDNDVSGAVFEWTWLYSVLAFR